MVKAIKYASKVSFLFLLGTLASAGASISQQPGKKLSVENIKRSLTPNTASADVPYSEGSYYGEGSYGGDGGGCGGGCGCGCCCACGCGCGCGCC